jgi:hypothetical protein
MARVAELQETRHFPQAISLLEKIEKKISPSETWSRAWVRTAVAISRSALGETLAARAVISELLKDLPEHPLGLCLNAIFTLTTDGYPAAMRAVNRAFHHALETQPFPLAEVARVVGMEMSTKGSYLGAGQFLGLATRLDPENERAANDYRLFLANKFIPYPLRDSYLLGKLPEDDPLYPQFKLAVELAGHVRFSEAAKAFGAVVRQNPNLPLVWKNIALCHAWAGEDPLAAEAFKAAANHEADFETSVDYLVLSRLLKRAQQAKVSGLSIRTPIKSVSSVLTILDRQPDFLRIELDDVAPANEIRPTALYQLLDRPKDATATADLTLENVPRNLADVAIYDQSAGEHHGYAVLFAFGSEHAESMRQKLLALCGDELQGLSDSHEIRFVPTELIQLFEKVVFPLDATVLQIDAILKQNMQHQQNDVWPNIPQEALGGKTPLEAAQIPELQKALAAAVVEFDSHAEGLGIFLDEAALRSRLGLPDVVLTNPETFGPNFGYSVLQLRHIDVNHLADYDLFAETEHARMIHPFRLYGVMLEEAFNRPRAKQSVEPSVFAMHLARLYTRHLDYERALDWSIRGKQLANEKHQPLSQMLLWDIQEINIRKHLPGDAEIPALAEKLWNYYLPKLPENRELIELVLKDVPIAGTWNHSNQPIRTSGSLMEPAASSPSGLWTPESAAAGQPSKLWLPGSE